MGLGAHFFLLIIKNVVSEEEKAAAVQTQKTLRIADRTLAYLRKGLQPDSATVVCKILHDEIPASAVAMTNKTEILAHIGAGSDHHRTAQPIQTQATRDVILTGQLLVSTKESIHCQKKDCPLSAAVIAPLKQREETIGTLKFYFHSEKEINKLAMEMISGLSSLLSNQLEIAEADKAYQLAKEAEINALQAQISPHFLFNSLNTIASLIRLDQIKARRLLLALSHFFRQNLTATTEKMTALEQELKHVKAYLDIEEARFIDRLSVTYDIASCTLDVRVPPLTLQPIVENAIKHGINNKRTHCTIEIQIKQLNEAVEVSVTDNGQGIDEERLHKLGKTTLPSKSGSGMALYNVNRRLRMMFGDKSELQISSKPEQGTTVSFTIPQTEELIHAKNN